MGATAFRPRRGPGGQYKARKERRARDRYVPQSRGHEGAPWYCYPLSAAAFEAQITKERIDNARAKAVEAAAMRLRAEESVNRAKKIAEKRAALKFSPLSPLKGEAIQAPA